MSTLELEFDKVVREAETERTIRDLKLAHERELLIGGLRYQTGIIPSPLYKLSPSHGELVPVSSDAEYNYVQSYRVPKPTWWDDTVKVSLTTKDNDMTRKDTVETIAIDVHATARVYVCIPEFPGESTNTKRNMRENYIEDELLRLRSKVFDTVSDLADQYTVAAVSVDSELVDEDVFARIDSCE